MTVMPQGWATIPIGEASGIGGLSTDGDWIESKDQDPSGSVRLIQLQDIGDGLFVNKSSRFLTEEKAEELHCTFLSPGDVLIARMPDPLGRACRFPDIGQKSVTAVDVHVWRKGELGVDPDFLVYCVNSPEIRQALQAQASGTTRQRVSGGRLKAQEIPLPPLPEQRRIVGKLDTLSARTTTARTHLTTIEKLVERYKASALISIFSGAATSEGMTTLDKVGRLVCGQSPASATVNRDGVGTPYCTGPEQWDGINVHLDKWTTDPKRTVDEESIFITVKGSGVGTLFPGTRCAIGRDVYAYVPEQDRLDWRFAFWALRYEIANILINVKGLIPGLSKPDILGNPVFVPCLEEQREIVCRIETAFARIDRLAAEAAKALKLLGRLDQRILAKAFAGELVPQDPTDEPAEALLARIRQARAAAPKPKRSRRARA